MTLPLRGMLAHGFDPDTARASALREASDDELIGELARRGRWLLEQPEAERDREDATVMDRQAERDPTRGGGAETVWTDLLWLLSEPMFPEDLVEHALYEDEDSVRAAIRAMLADDSIRRVPGGLVERRPVLG